MIYFDNSATTLPCETAVNSFNSAILKFGNPSSLHKLGIESEKILSAARTSVAYALDCRDDEIFFTSGATESNNLSLFGSAETYGKRKTKIIASNIEHPSVTMPLKKLSEKYDVVFCNPDEIIKNTDENTCLVSVQLVNNETGRCLPVSEIFDEIKCKFPHIITHCDATQGFLKIPINVYNLQADLISISAHKVHSVKGVGSLYVKKGIRLAPLFYGGGQEKNIRPGTENVPGIAAFGDTVFEFFKHREENYEIVYDLNKYLRKKLAELDFITINSVGDCIPHIINFSVKNVKSETMLHFLENKEIYISSGSACSRGKKSEVLKNMGLSDYIVDSALRTSFSHFNTKDEIDIFVKEITNGYLRILKK
ncbi:MAG: cysteine desulfurase [Ruminococcus sp.]|jgi:cysteine desulfurase|nr:cysteine desulfurase [Ruminococcus sp.]